MIFDTNILIYLSKYTLKPEELIKQDSSISIVTKMEASGYTFQNIEEYKLLSDICDVLSITPLSDDIANETIRLRKTYRVKLADGIIYSTALVPNMPLFTNNISDFKSLDGRVKLVNPFEL